MNNKISYYNELCNDDIMGSLRINKFTVSSVKFSTNHQENISKLAPQSSNC